MFREFFTGANCNIDASSSNCKAVIIEASEAVSFTIACLTKIISLLADSIKIEVIPMIAAFTFVSIVVEITAFNRNSNAFSTNKIIFWGTFGAEPIYFSLTVGNSGYSRCFRLPVLDSVLDVIRAG